MKRVAFSRLERWYGKSRRKPLIIRGARQVGKTELVRLFASAQRAQLIEINLERHLELTKIFSRMNPAHILLELEGVAGRKIDTENSILFLDEIQAIPEAIASLRYFYEEFPELAVISAGSLLEFVLEDHVFPMPVGRIEYLHLGPMTFSEYLEAVDPFMAEWLLTTFMGRVVSDVNLEHVIPETIHLKFIDLLREYLAVGGMPEAVLAYHEEKDFSAVSEVQNSIIETYADDFSKYAKKSELARLQNIFRSIPAQVGRKVIYSRFSEEEKSREIRKSLELLIQARIAAKVIHSSGNGTPLGAEINEKVFKLLFLDIGLMNRLNGLPVQTIKTMHDRKLVSEGSLAEQFIGQHLLQDTHLNSPLCLHYWQRAGKSSNAEIDYLIPFNSGVIPVEVKAGKSGSLKSLHQFMLEKSVQTAVRFDSNRPSVQHIHVQTTQNKSVFYQLISLPLYAVEQVTALLEQRV